MRFGMIGRERGAQPTVRSRAGIFERLRCQGRQIDRNLGRLMVETDCLALAARPRQLMILALITKFFAAKPEPDIEELARKLNVASRSIGRDLRFEVNMDSGHSVIQVLDRETGEVIRQIPPEKAQLYLSASGGVNLRLIDEQI